MNKVFSVFILFTVLGSASAKISFSPTASLNDISIDTIYVEGIEYHQPGSLFQVNIIFIPRRQGF